MVELVCIIIFILIFLYFMDETFFYHKQKEYCKRYHGLCEKCDCWSCDHKYYINK